MSKPSIFLTGASGLLGSHLAAFLLHRKKAVLALNRNNSNKSQVKRIYALLFPEEAFPEELLHWVEGDMEDYALLVNSLDGIDEVYHAAALVSFNPADEAEMIRTNVNGTAALVNAALETGVKKFCHVSSTAALGKEDRDGFIDEKSPRNQADDYSAYSLSKFYSENEVWRGMEEGLNAVIVNPSVILGPGDWTRSSGQLFRTVAKGMPFYTTGVTGYVDVRDVVTVMLSLMEKSMWGERFCVSAHNWSVREVFSEIAVRVDKKPPRWEAKPWMIALAYRWGAVFKGKNQSLTRDSARSAFSKHYYRSDKVREALSFTFMSKEETWDYALKRL